MPRTCGDRREGRVTVPCQRALGTRDRAGSVSSSERLARKRVRDVRVAATRLSPSRAIRALVRDSINLPEGKRLVSRQSRGATTAEIFRRSGAMRGHRERISSRAYNAPRDDVLPATFRVIRQLVLAERPTTPNDVMTRRCV